MIANDRRPEALAMLEAAIEKALIESAETVVNEAKILCPKDTGNLANSIERSDVEDNTVAVGTNVEYGPPVELGTSKMAPRPYLGAAIKGKQGEIVNIFNRELANMKR